MKVEIKNQEYGYISDNSKEVDLSGAYLVTYHNSKYMKEARDRGCEHFITPEELYHMWGLQEGIQIVGITGTNGKTSTSNIIGYILKRLGETVAVSGTEGIFLHSAQGVEQIVARGNTTPEIFNTLINLQKAKAKGATFFVMEVSSHGIDQKRIEGIEFDAKVFTNLTHDHIDYHKTFENYVEVKSSFFMDDHSTKVINADDPHIRFNQSNVILYSVEGHDRARIQVKSIEHQNGVKAQLLCECREYILKAMVTGKFNTYNILAAVETVCAITDYKLGEVLSTLEDFSGVDGRMETVFQEYMESGGVIEVFVDYAHTPDAIKNVLESIQQEGREVFALVGAGGDRDKTKRPEMSEVACQHSDYVVITSDNPRFENPESIIEDMKKGVESFIKYQIVQDRKEAIKNILQKAYQKSESGDDVIVAILGKGNENYMDIQGDKIPYSDREEILSFFKKL